MDVKIANEVISSVSDFLFCLSIKTEEKSYFFFKVFARWMDVDIWNITSIKAFHPCKPNSWKPHQGSYQFFARPHFKPIFSKVGKINLPRHKKFYFEIFQNVLFMYFPYTYWIIMQRRKWLIITDGHVLLIYGSRLWDLLLSSFLVDFLTALDKYLLYLFLVVYVNFSFCRFCWMNWYCTSLTPMG